MDLNLTPHDTCKRNIHILLIRALVTFHLDNKYYCFVASTLATLCISDNLPNMHFLSINTVPSMPREFDVASKTFHSLYIRWQKPQPSHGMVVGYKIAYWRTDLAGQDNRSVAINGPAGVGWGNHFIQHHYNITELMPYTRYSLQVSTLACHVEHRREH